jgi:hypothetical protein
MFACCECCVLSGRGLCDELITRPKECYRLWCVVVCDQEKTNLVNEEAKAHWGAVAPRKKNRLKLQFLGLRSFLVTGFSCLFFGDKAAGA